MTLGNVSTLVPNLWSFWCYFVTADASEKAAMGGRHARGDKKRCHGDAEKGTIICDKVLTSNHRHFQMHVRLVHNTS